MKIIVVEIVLETVETVESNTVSSILERAKQEIRDKEIIERDNEKIVLAMEDIIEKISKDLKLKIDPLSLTISNPHTFQNGLGINVEVKIGNNKVHCGVLKSGIEILVTCPTTYTKELGYKFIFEPKVTFTTESIFRDNPIYEFKGSEDLLNICEHNLEEMYRTR